METQPLSPAPHVAGQFKTIAQIRRANRAIGHYWFDKDTMEFFGTIIDPVIYEGRYFVTQDNPPAWQESAETSEFPYPIVARWTIRRANDDGSINTVGKFRQYHSSKSAHDAARKAAKGEAR